MKKLVIVAIIVAAVAGTVKAFARTPITTCQWPNTCGLVQPEFKQINAVAQYQPCVWPNRCAVAL